MGDAAVKLVQCGTCGERHDAAAVSRIAAGGRVPCARCGSEVVKVAVHVAETVNLQERLDLKARRPGIKRPFMEQRAGDDLHREMGGGTKIHRLIDRDNDRYVEYIIDDEGYVVRDVDVPLNEHRGHGADHSQPKSHP